MILYHGSNVVVEKPKIIPQLSALDFGAGFYLTSNRQQAEKWARNVCKRRLVGTPILNMYGFEDGDLNNLEVLRFDKADGNWLDFVVSNRKRDYYDKKYDIVIGPVANDTTIRVIDDYMSGVYIKEEAIKRLLPQKLTDQYAFLTVEALELLRFEGGNSIWQKQM